MLLSSQLLSSFTIDAGVAFTTPHKSFGGLTAGVLLTGFTFFLLGVKPQRKDLNLMKTYRLHFICSAEPCAQADSLSPDIAAELADAAEEGNYPRPAKVYYAPLRCCELTAEILYPHLLAQQADFLLPFAQPDEGATKAVKTMLQEMMNAGFTEAAVIAESKVLSQMLTSYALPERPTEEWSFQPGKGYTLLTDAALWMRCAKLEVYDTIPSQAESGYADDEAYLDYAESLLDEGMV